MAGSDSSGMHLLDLTQAGCSHKSQVKLHELGTAIPGWFHCNLLLDLTHMAASDSNQVQHMDSSRTQPFMN